VIVYDDFCADTRKCYQDVLDFIGVPDDNRSSFPVVNGARAHSIGALPKLIMQPPRWLVPVLCDLVRPTLRAVGIRQIRNTIIESMARSTRRVPLREEFRLELAAAFEEEVALLSELLERDLSHWLAAPRTSSSPTSGMSRSAPPCIVPL
jgi:hypothetical protein